MLKSLLTEQEILEYLDVCIDFYRDLRDNVESSEEQKTMAKHYIDAFQSVRCTIFDELRELPKS